MSSGDFSFEVKEPLKVYVAETLSVDELKTIELGEFVNNLVCKEFGQLDFHLPKVENLGHVIVGIKGVPTFSNLTPGNKQCLIIEYPKDIIVVPIAEFCDMADYIGGTVCTFKATEANFKDYTSGLCYSYPRQWCKFPKIDERMRAILSEMICKETEQMGKVIQEHIIELLGGTLREYEKQKDK